MSNIIDCKVIAGEHAVYRHYHHRLVVVTTRCGTMKLRKKSQQKKNKIKVWQGHTLEEYRVGLRMKCVEIELRDNRRR